MSDLTQRKIAAVFFIIFLPAVLLPTIDWTGHDPADGAIVFFLPLIFICWLSIFSVLFERDERGGA